MPNNFFNFKKFTIHQNKSAFKVGTDGVLLGAIAEASGASKILDIGTGTGLIALMIAQRCDAEIVAIEPDSESFEEALANVAGSEWYNRIRVLNTSLQDYDPGNEKFDLIVSNPPFFNDSLRNPDPRISATRHSFNLTSDDLLAGTAKLLKKNGRLQIILPYAEGNVFIALASVYGFYCNNILKIKPLPTSEIRRMILTFSGNRLPVTEKFLTIEHGPRHDFTDDYKNLTKDFYLKF